MGSEQVLPGATRDKHEPPGRASAKDRLMKNPNAARTNKSPLGSLGRHVRDWFIHAFPLEMRTASGLTVRLRNRSELAVYRNIFVERVYPFDTFAREIGTTASPVVLDVG